VLLRDSNPYNLKDGIYFVRDNRFRFVNDHQGLLTITRKKILTIDPASSIPEFLIESLNQVCIESGIPEDQHLKWPVLIEIYVRWKYKETIIATASVFPESFLTMD
jgi:hypothetical protein